MHNQNKTPNDEPNQETIENVTGSQCNESHNDALNEETIKNVGANDQHVQWEKVVVDIEVEFVHILGQKLQAIESQPTYRTKVIDELCGKNPFKENVCVSYNIRF